MSIAERESVAARDRIRSRRRTIAANVLVACAVLVLLLMAAYDAFFLTQWNVVGRLFVLGGLLLMGWIPVALAIVAVCLRPYWPTFVLLGVVGAAVLATLALVWFLPEAADTNPQISWPRRG
ncbi:hypothetical protein [uncultured Leifsonia sp.]|uniref:hypothetical protein n=1 Tax=uncultured Leifsonia sp. TaxID=340359 RepID=UPI0028D327EB|nr:hypothetical protein [uncultured Leifsonia sp.]